MPELHDAADYVPKQSGRISPADRMVAELDGEYYTIRNVAEIIEISKEAVRKALKSAKTSVGPSKVMTHGGLEVWLLDRDGLLATADHFDKLPLAKKYLNNK